MMNLQGKVAVITGASSGIGRSLAVKLTAKGASIVLAARNKNKLEALAEMLGRQSAHCLICVTDATQKDQVELMIDSAVERFGRIDILVNCAGAGMYGKIADASLDQIRHIFDLNFFGPVYAIQKAYPIMAKAGGGVIVNISSTAGFRSWPNNGYYCATKHALNAINESLMLEGQKDGIRTLLVMAGTTNTSFIENSLNVEESLKKHPPIDMSPDTAADNIIKAISTGKSRIVLTAKGKILSFLNRCSPALVDKMLSSKA